MTRGDQDRRPRERRFERGDDAVARFLPSAPHAYICPLCGRGFERRCLGDGWLTDEHVPPSAVGHRLIMLTRKECNNAAGGTVDRQMLSFNNHLDFELGTLAKPTRAQMQLGENLINIEVTRDVESAHFFRLARYNHPLIQQAWDEEMARRAARDTPDGDEYLIRLWDGYRIETAMLGWLRAAFLVAFTAFGYHYIFSPLANDIHKFFARKGPVTAL